MMKKEDFEIIDGVKDFSTKHQRLVFQTIENNFYVIDVKDNLVFCLDFKGGKIKSFKTSYNNIVIETTDP